MYEKQMRLGSIATGYRRRKLSDKFTTCGECQCATASRSNCWIFLHQFRTYRGCLNRQIETKTTLSILECLEESDYIPHFLFLLSPPSTSRPTIAKQVAILLPSSGFARSPWLSRGLLKTENMPAISRAGNHCHQPVMTWMIALVFFVLSSLPSTYFGSCTQR